jgi:phosphatidylglycerophosphate synthase
MPTVRTGPVTGLVIQLALLAGLAVGPGLAAGGWVAGVAYGLAVCAALTWGLRRPGWPGGADFGPANWVTLVRAGLAGAITALVVEAFTRQVPVPLLVTICSLALALDAVDGYVARRTGTVTELGARFDMEIDAFLILVLSVHVSRELGPWVLIIGAMRYAYLAATWLVPWLPGPLPPRYWRKVVAAIQGIVLVVAAAGVLGRPLTAVAVLAALALLTESFGRDVWWRWHARPALVTRRRTQIHHEPV